MLISHHAKFKYKRHSGYIKILPNVSYFGLNIVFFRLSAVSLDSARELGDAENVTSTDLKVTSVEQCRYLL